MKCNRTVGVSRPALLVWSAWWEAAQQPFEYRGPRWTRCMVRQFSLFSRVSSEFWRFVVFPCAGLRVESRTFECEGMVVIKTLPCECRCAPPRFKHSAEFLLVLPWNWFLLLVFCVLLPECRPTTTWYSLSSGRVCGRFARLLTACLCRLLKGSCLPFHFLRGLSHQHTCTISFSRAYRPSR